MSDVTVSVITVTYRPGESLITFLDTLSHAGGDVREIVLADNGEGEPLDPDVQAQSHREGVRVLRTGGNIGYGGAANKAAASVTSEFVVVANPDLLWHEAALEQMLAATHRWPQAGAFGPQILTSSGEIYPSARSLPSLGRGTAHALFGWWWPSNPWTVSYRNEQRRQGESAVGWLSGACVLLRREAFEQVGGFDDGYFMYFEDVDLGDRLGRAGWQNVYVPSAQVTHSGAHATSREPARMATEHHRSAWRYLSRRYTGLRWAPVRAVLFAGLQARAALARRAPAVASGARPNDPIR